MKVKIVGDGTFNNTKVLNGETGEQIHRIVSLDIHCDSESKYFTAYMEMYPVEVDLEANVEQIKIGNTMYHPYPCPICNSSN